MRIDDSLLGKLVTVKFLDHAAYSKELCVCRVAGWVVSVDHKSIAIAWWDLLDAEDEETQETNQEHCSIIISAIEEIRVIEPADCPTLAQ